MRIIKPEESKKLVLKDGEHVFCSVCKDLLLPVVVTSPKEAHEWYESKGLPLESFLEMIEEKIKDFYPLTEKVISLKAEIWNDSTKRQLST